MTPRAVKRSRNIRVEDALWEAAQAVAEARNEVLSEEIRKFLVRYTKKASK